MSDYTLNFFKEKRNINWWRYCGHGGHDPRRLFSPAPSMQARSLTQSLGKNHCAALRFARSLLPLLSSGSGPAPSISSHRHHRLLEAGGIIVPSLARHRCYLGNERTVAMGGEGREEGCGSVLLSTFFLLPATRPPSTGMEGRTPVTFIVQVFHIKPGIQGAWV